MLLRLVGASFVLVFAGAASVTAAPRPDLVELHAMDRSVGVVGARLAIAGRNMCKRRVGTLGITLDDSARYAPALHDAAAKIIGSATLPVVIALVEGGAAQRAGVHVGDAIAAVDNWNVPSPSSFDRADLVLDHVESVPPPRPITLHIGRGGKIFVLQAITQWSCLTRFQVLPGGPIQASANGTRVEVGSELVGAVRSQDELAVILAHELAHNILDHHGRLAAAGAFAQWRVSSQTAKLAYASEIEADRLAVYLCAIGGFDLHAFQTAWSRLGPGGGRDHPPNATRFALVADEIRRAQSQREREQTMRPEGLDAYMRAPD